MTYRLTSLAEQEIESALRYYADVDAGLGVKFLVDVEGTINRILAMPEAWKPLSRRTRRCLLHHFPFGIIYQIRESEIVIVSVMDLRRDPSSAAPLL